MYTDPVSVLLTEVLKHEHCGALTGRANPISEDIDAHGGYLGGEDTWGIPGKS